MQTNKLRHLVTLKRTFILAFIFAVIALFWIPMSSDTDANKIVTKSDSSKKESTTKNLDKQNTSSLLWSPLVAGTNTILGITPPEISNSPSASTGSSARPQTSPTATQPPVAKATKTKLMDLATAENQFYTNDNRLFVTGNGGIFEIVARSASDVSIIDHTPKQRNCDFGGIVELYGVLYVNCSTLGPSYIYAATLTATPAFKQIYAFKSAVLPNGLTVDNSGNLYDASMFAGQILRLTPSATNPLTFAKTGVWLNGTGPLTDGIKFYNGSLYWTDGQFMNRIVVKADGKPGQQTRLLTTAPTILDDLTINNDGILVADHVYGVIRKFDLNGRSTGTIPAKFTTPSSVLWARPPFPAGSLIVTERSANQVTLVTP